MKRIAVIEDEAYTRDELCNMLEKAGYSALEVTAFEEAAEQVAALAPDLLICRKSAVSRFAGTSSRKPPFQFWS